MSTSKKYAIEVFAPGSRGYTSICSIKSDEPFLPIQKGDIINPVSWTEHYANLAKDSAPDCQHGAVFIVIAVEHFIVQTETGFRTHKIGLYTEALDDTADSRRERVTAQLLATGFKSKISHVSSDASCQTKHQTKDFNMDFQSMTDMGLHLRLKQLNDTFVPMQTVAHYSKEFAESAETKKRLQGLDTEITAIRAELEGRRQQGLSGPRAA